MRKVALTIAVTAVLAGTAVGFAKIAFFVFIILALLSFVFRGGRGSVA